MAEPLEITLKFGDKTHPVTIKHGDADTAAEAFLTLLCESGLDDRVN